MDLDETHSEILPNIWQKQQSESEAKTADVKLRSHLFVVQKSELACVPSLAACYHLLDHFQLSHHADAIKLLTINKN